MASITVTRVILKCDGCGALHGSPGGHRSAMDARAAAYAEGWRFPPKVTRTGREANGAKNTSDVCATCIENWTARPMGATEGNVYARGADAPQ